MLRDSSHSAVAKALSGKGSRRSSWAVPTSDQSRVHPQFAFVLHALAFTPGALGMELVAQGLSLLRHVPDLSMALHTWGKQGTSWEAPAGVRMSRVGSRVHACGT